MSNKVKDIDMENRANYFFGCMINMKNFDPDKIKIDEKSYRNVLIYYIGYVTIEGLKYGKIISVNVLYYLFSKVNGTLKKLIKISIWR